MRRERSGKGRRLSAALVALVVLALVSATYYFVRPQYSFLGQFDAMRRISTWAQGSGKLSLDSRCYSFTSNPVATLREVRGEMTSVGWTVDYEDPALLIFTKSHDGAREEACFATRTDDWDSSSEAATTTSVLWLPYHSNWIEDHLSRLLSSLGWEKKPTPTDVAPFSANPYAVMVDRNDSSSKLDIVWRNFYRKPMTIQIDSVDLMNYDADTDMPRSLTIPPRSGIAQSFAFHGLRNLWPHNRINIEMELLQPPLGKIWRWDKMAEPGFSATQEDDGKLIQIVNADPSRAYEIRNLKVADTGSVRFPKPGIVQIQVGGSLDFRIKDSDGDEPSISYDYRLLPNTRWRHFEFGDE